MSGNSSSKDDPSATPDRDCEWKFRTPVARTSVPNWSPNIRFATPNLSSPTLEIAKTPIMLASLGIRPETDLDLSWKSCMATPSAGFDVHSTSVYHTPCEVPEEKSKVVQKRRLSFKDGSETDTNENEQEMEIKPLSVIREEDAMMKDEASASVSHNMTSGHQSILSFLEKPPSKFIYPKPVFVHMKGIYGAQKHSHSLKPKVLDTVQPDSDDESVPSPVISQRQPKKKKHARKILHFDDHFSSSGSSVSSQEKMIKENITTKVSCENLQVHNQIPDKSIPTVNGSINSTSDALCSFSTAGGKHLAVSDEALSRAKAWFQEVESGDSCPNLHNSKSSLLNKVRSKELHPDYEAQNSLHAPPSNRNHQNGRAAVADEEFSRKCATTTSENQVEKSAANKSSVPSFGFSTASGKQVPISVVALDRARKIFEDCGELEGKGSDIDLHISNSGKNSVKLPIRNAKHSSPSCEYPTKTDSINHGYASQAVNLASDRTDSSVGFSTASGKNIAISAQSLTRAKQMFEDVPSDSEAKHEVSAPSRKYGTCSPSTIPDAGSVGFSTASGKSFTFSTESLTRARRMFDEIDSYPSESIKLPTRDAHARTPCFREYSTADGKDIRVSSKSMAQSGKRFGEITSGKSRGQEIASEDHLLPNITLPSCNGPVGFATASGKGVSVSAQSLARANKIFTDCHSGTNEVQESVANFVERNSVQSHASIHRKDSNIAQPSDGYAVAEKNTEIFNSKKETTVRTKYGTPSEASTLGGAKTAVSTRPHGDEEARKRKMNDDEYDSDPPASPTIGKKKRRNSPLNNSYNEFQSTQTQFSIWDIDPTCVANEILNARRKARQNQQVTIEAKRKRRLETPVNPGLLYQSKSNPSGKKSSLTDLARGAFGKTSLPPIRSPEELIAMGVLASVCSVHAANAGSFKFYGWEFFSLDSCRSNALGFRLGEFQLILADDNTIGCEEISACFMASSNVDPNLISVDWIKNHYRWIVWKLASLEQRFPELLGRQCLTPVNVLEQLKYRYDREIDCCQRPALRRIIEQDDSAAKTMVLCVCGVDVTGPTGILELTDGWYKINAFVDPVLKHFAESGKICVGLKLVVSGAELVASAPSSPLEAGDGTHLKITANSVRRARWSARLGFLTHQRSMAINLRSILPEGGLIPLLRIVVARIYPLVYMEKTAEGKTVFRSERFHRKVCESAASDYERIMEKMMEDIEREADECERKNRKINGKSADLNLTDEEKRRKFQLEAQKRMEQMLAARKNKERVAVVRLRLVDWKSKDLNSAVLSIWRPADDLSLIKENRPYDLYNVTASGLRFGEIQLNAIKQTRWREIHESSKRRDQTINSQVPYASCERTVASFQANFRGFKPVFNELDLVGLVVHVGKSSNKNSFQTAVLYDGTAYFGIKCWSGFEDYALEDVVVAGVFLAFANLQWRTNSWSGKFPSAFISEATVVSTRPAAKHLDQALSQLKQRLRDPAACVIEAESHVIHLLSTSGTPNASTPNQLINEERKQLNTPICRSLENEGDTPVTRPPATQPTSRSRLLEKYGPAPILLPLNITPSTNVRQRFKPPSRKSPAI